jgi:hypothetical protein
LLAVLYYVNPQQHFLSPIVSFALINIIYVAFIPIVFNKMAFYFTLWLYIATIKKRLPCSRPLSIIVLSTEYMSIIVLRFALLARVSIPFKFQNGFIIG